MATNAPAAVAAQDAAQNKAVLGSMNGEGDGVQNPSVMPMLYVRQLSKTFNPGTQMAHKALTGVDLALAPGEFACIVGSNGAGKSTLFNAIAGSVMPDAGLVELDGENITFQPDYRRARRMSRVFQDPLAGTSPHLTVAENIALAYGRSTSTLGLRRAMRKDVRVFVRERLAELGFGLEERMDVKVGSLSGGQRQAVTMLMATIGAPKLLLLDEHTAALDPAATQRILELTNQVVREGNIATLMITHDLGDALALGDRTIVMHEGAIVADVHGQERAHMSVSDLLELFHAQTHATLADDKMLLV
jgi:putative ABC transport system ATP-binding protein